MPRERNPLRNKAREIYIQHNGKISLCEISEQLNLPEGTIRGWKSKDLWDETLNGTFQSKIRSVPNENTERSKRNKKESTLNKIDSKGAFHNTVDAISKTNESPENIKTRGGQRENQNALGHGAPLRNRNAERTGEYITIYFDDLDEREKDIIGASRELGVYQKLLLQDAQYTVLEKRIRERIKELKDKPNGMDTKSITLQKIEVKEQQQSITSKEVVSVAVEIFKREQALSNVMARHAKILVDLAKLEQMDERLSISLIKLESEIKDPTEEIQNSNFLEALEKAADEVWEDGEI